LHVFGSHLESDSEASNSSTRSTQAKFSKVNFTPFTSYKGQGNASDFLVDESSNEVTSSGEGNHIQSFQKTATLNFGCNKKSVNSSADFNTDGFNAGGLSFGHSYSNSSNYGAVKASQLSGFLKNSTSSQNEPFQNMMWNNLNNVTKQQNKILEIVEKNVETSNVKAEVPVARFVGQLIKYFDRDA
jgi:hypothetical protein